MERVTVGGGRWCHSSNNALGTRGGAAVVDQIVENCNTFIIQRQNSAKSAETLAGIVGTREDVEVTTQVYRTPIGDFGFGMGTVRSVREFIVHPMPSYGYAGM